MDISGTCGLNAKFRGVLESWVLAEQRGTVTDFMTALILVFLYFKVKWLIYRLLFQAVAEELDSLLPCVTHDDPPPLWIARGGKLEI